MQAVNAVSESMCALTHTFTLTQRIEIIDTLSTTAHSMTRACNHTWPSEILLFLPFVFGCDSICGFDRT